MRTLDSQTGDAHAWGHLQNAMAVLTELIMMNRDLVAVQAILGMAIALHASPNSRRCSVLTSTAVKIAQSINLHRRDQGTGLSATEIEQRKRVFWLAYIYDKDMSLQTGDPPSQDDDDMDVDLPTETIELNPTGVVDINFFNLRIGLAIIQGQIYKRLSSTKALKHSEIERSLAAKELDAILETWKRSVPIGFSNVNTNTALDSSLPTLLHTVVLKFTYFNALITIHRSILANSHSHIKSAEAKARRQSPSVALLIDDFCLSEARKSMQLLPMMPQGHYAWVWLIFHHLFQASTIILSHVILNSDPTVANEDLDLIKPVLKLLKGLKNEVKNSDVKRMEESLNDLWKKAKSVVRGVKGHKRIEWDDGDEAGYANNNGSKGIKSLEDFISRIEILSTDRCESYNRTLVGHESGLV